MSTTGYLGAALDAAADAMYGDKGDIDMPFLEDEWRAARRQEAADVVSAFLEALAPEVVYAAIPDTDTVDYDTGDVLRAVRSMLSKPSSSGGAA